MESKLRDAVEKISTRLKRDKEIDGIELELDQVKAEECLLAFARTHLSAIEKGEVPKKMEVFYDKYMPGIDTPTVSREYLLGWNACHDEFTHHYVAQKMEIEELTAKIEKLCNELGVMMVESQLLKSQLSNKMTRERVVEIIFKAQREFNILGMVGAEKLADLLMEEWGVLKRSS
jgi:hypothetical protein